MRVEASVGTTTALAPARPPPGSSHQHANRARRPGSMAAEICLARLRARRTGRPSRRT
jgi:hypothetical protein